MGRPSHKRNSQQDVQENKIKMSLDNEVAQLALYVKEGVIAVMKNSKFKSSTLVVFAIAHEVIESEHYYYPEDGPKVYPFETSTKYAQFMRNSVSNYTANASEAIEPEEEEESPRKKLRSASGSTVAKKNITSGVAKDTGEGSKAEASPKKRKFLSTDVTATPSHHDTNFLRMFNSPSKTASKVGRSPHSHIDGITGGVGVLGRFGGLALNSTSKPKSVNWEAGLTNDAPSPSNRRQPATPAGPSAAQSSSTARSATPKGPKMKK